MSKKHALRQLTLEGFVEPLEELHVVRGGSTAELRHIQLLSYKVCIRAGRCFQVLAAPP